MFLTVHHYTWKDCFRVLGNPNAHSPYISVSYSTTLFYRHTMTGLVPVLAQNVAVW